MKTSMIVGREKDIATLEALLVTGTYGIMPNEHSAGLVDKELQMDALFGV